MTSEALWHRLTPIYDPGEAKALIRWVLDMRFGLSLADILCGKITELSSNDQAELEKIMLRLEKGEPVQYITGKTDFCGRSFKVTPAVLIPRPETEELCRWITEEVRSGACHILDIGTGSGCIAITLAADIPGAKVTAWDISEEALRIASENARLHNVDVTFEKHDILHPSLAALHDARFTCIVSNPPYIQPRERDGMDKNVLDHEPSIALFAPEEDPIAFYRHIGNYAIKALKPGGLLYFELNPLTAKTVADYLRQLGFQDVEIKPDQFGKQRFLKTKKI